MPSEPVPSAPEYHFARPFPCLLPLCGVRLPFDAASQPIDLLAATTCPPTLPLWRQLRRANLRIVFRTWSPAPAETAQPALSASTTRCVIRVPPRQRGDLETRGVEWRWSTRRRDADGQHPTQHAKPAHAACLRALHKRKVGRVIYTLI